MRNKKGYMLALAAVFVLSLANLTGFCSHLA
jgi:hypothetical protein